MVDKTRSTGLTVVGSLVRCERDWTTEVDMKFIDNFTLAPGLYRVTFERLEDSDPIDLEQIMDEDE